MFRNILLCSDVLLQNKAILLLRMTAIRMKKSLIASYNHPKTAEFFKNVMHKIKRDLYADGMDADAFEYSYCWNKVANCIEHAVIPTKDQNFTIHNPFVTGLSAVIRVFKGERYVHVNSYKPTAGQMQHKLLQSGWKSVAHKTDQSERLATHLCIAI